MTTIGVGVPEGKVACQKLPRLEDTENVELIDEIAGGEVSPVLSDRGDDSPEEERTEKRQQHRCQDL